jgi:hypothetical protein
LRTRSCRDFFQRVPDPSQRWLAFVGNHAQAIVACDFLVVVTAGFRILYMCSFSWNWVGDEFSTSTSLITPARSGPNSNCAKHFPPVLGAGRIVIRSGGALSLKQAEEDANVRRAGEAYKVHLGSQSPMREPSAGEWESS